jgi:hypothetical protein
MRRRGRLTLAAGSAVAVAAAVTSAVVLVPRGGEGAGGAAGAGTSADALLAARHAPCPHVGHRDVRGARPTYTSQRLASFANDDALCAGVWLPRPRAQLVPQALALGGRHTAWVVGYRTGPMGERPCRLFRIDLRTGKRVTYQPQVVGRVGTQPQQYCRHGGGVAAAGGMLWIVEKHKLWRYDPRRAGSSPEATRVWRVQMPVQGSTVVVRGDLLGLVPFTKTGTPSIRWYRFADVLRRGVTDLADTAKAPKQVAPVRLTRVPTYVQGAAFGPKGRLFVTRSSTRCGELMALGGRRIAFVPGAEQLQLDTGGKRLWVVSESGARPFQQKATPPPLTPAISAFAWPQVLKGPASTCHFGD